MERGKEWDGGHGMGKYCDFSSWQTGRVWRENPENQRDASCACPCSVGGLWEKLGGSMVIFPFIPFLPGGLALLIPFQGVDTRYPILFMKFPPMTLQESHDGLENVLCLR